jgi:hypothetical protein
MPQRLALAALLATASLAVHATPQTYDATDMWFTSSESGWGLNVIHQGNTLFATFFVYGPDGQPTWYVASGLVGGDDGPLHDQGFVFTGPLYASTGTWFGAPAFDPAASTRTQVGTVRLEVGINSAILDYTVNGLHVGKVLTRFGFRASNLAGLHRAWEYQPAFQPDAPNPGTPQVSRQSERFSVQDDGTHVGISTGDDSQPDCEYAGTRELFGQYQRVSGSYSCGGSGSAGQGTWSMTVDPTPDGFTGFFTGNGINSFWGRVAGSLANPPKMEGTGWRSGMWFVPSESGWGLNVIEQGDTIFATLFVYDANGKPHWYVGSQLAQSGSTSDGTAVNTGALYEATGPYFGASSFDPSGVDRRQVGTMSFHLTSPGNAVLSYAIDGVPVTKNVTAFTFAREDSSGTYNGQIAEASGGHDPAIITVNDGGSTLAMKVDGMYGGSCDYSGPLQQLGRSLHASGTVQCALGGSATFVLKDLRVSFNGITGHVDLANITGFVQDGLRSFALSGARANAN